MVLFALASVAMASSGSFGEVAGPLTYNAFVTNAQTRTWTIVNNYNFSLGFYIVKPNLTDASINTSVANGLIQSGKYYKINVTVVSHTTDTQSAYITAYAVPNNTNSTGGGSVIRLAVIKLIKINGTNITISNQAPPQSGANASNQTTGTKIQGQGIKGSTSSIPKNNIQKNTTGIQSPTATPAQSKPLGTYLTIVIAIIVACGIVYYAISRTKNTKKITSKKGRGKN